jgi:hypothetical protein
LMGFLGPVSYKVGRQFRVLDWILHPNFAAGCNCWAVVQALDAQKKKKKKKKKGRRDTRFVLTSLTLPW